MTMPSCRPSVGVVFAALAAAFVPSAALAQNAPAAPGESASPTGSSAPDAESEQWIRQGVELRRRGEDQAAFDLFRRAFERAHTARAEAQMGLAEQALGRWLDAEGHLREVLATSDPWVLANRGALEASLNAASQHIGRLDVTGLPDGAEIWVDGRRTATAPLAAPMRVLTGSARLEVRAPGFLTAQRAISVTAGQLTREHFDLVPATDEANTPTTGAAATPSGTQAVDTQTASTSATRRLPPWVFGVGVGATVVAAGTMAVLGGVTSGAHDRYLRDPTEAHYNDGVALQAATNTMVAVTVVLGVATAAVGLFATDWSATRERRASHRVRPVLGFDGRGGALLGLGGNL